MDGCVGDDFLYFEWTHLFHLECLGTIHVEVGCLQPCFVSDIPGSKFGGYPFLHFLLGNLVDSLGVISCCGQV